MEFQFAKLHGLGNDFVFIEDWDARVDLSAAQVAELCDRHKGIGADGVILVRSSQRTECAAYMHYINSDGTLAQMCGNGVRCFAKFLVDRGYVDPAAGSFVADTLSGPKPISFTLDDRNLMAAATVDMGAPELEAKRIPLSEDYLDDSDEREAEAPIVALESPWGSYSFACVSMGNPHAVCFIDSFVDIPDALFDDVHVKTLDTLDIDRIGAYFEAHPAFPEKTNVEFVDAREDGLHMRVFERGCGETMACGTGACAVNVAAALTGRAGRENDVILPGGTLHINWSDDGRVLMTGPAEQSFTGEVEIA